MAGGDREAYERVRPLFEAAAARVDGEPCAVYLGPGSVGHYAKMVHNGIEYAIMQLIAECYGLMKQGLGLGADKLHAVFEQWNREELNSYLLDITAQVFRQADAASGAPLIDDVPDAVGLRGTGKWSVQDAMELEAPVPTMSMAIAMRSLSMAKGERETASTILAGPKNLFLEDRKTFLEQLKNALYASMIITFAQGMTQLCRASRTYHYQLEMADIARGWRGGCIIRCALMKEILLSSQERPELVNLLLDPFLGQEVMARQADLRVVVRTATDLGIAVPGLMASLAYYDSYRSEWLPLNLIRAQRDHLGFHTTDKD
jgi:6-phosphogluconate dehydrogenase